MPNSLDVNIREFKTKVRDFYINTYIGSTGVPTNIEGWFWLAAQNQTTSMFPSYTGLLTLAFNARSFAADLESGISIVDKARAIVDQAQSQWYQRYWNLIGPYYSTQEICSMLGLNSMVDFYKRLGIPPAVETAANNYASGQISLDQLRQTMYLDSNEQVQESLQNFGTTIMTRRYFTDNGVLFSNTEVANALKLTAQFYNSLSGTDQVLFESVINALNQANITTVSQVDDFFAVTIYGDGSTYNSIRANSGDTTVSGTSGADLIRGNNANNIIVGGTGNDILEGFGGNDLLQGGEGNDVYLYAPNEGNDTIADVALIGETNKLVFTSGIHPSEITLSRSSDDLVFTLSENRGSVTVQNWFASVVGGTYVMSEVIFDDTNTVWTLSEIEAMLVDLTPAPDQTSHATSRSTSNYQLDRAVMDIAIADMNLNGDCSEQVCESLGYVPAYDSNPVGVSASVSGELLLEDERKTA
ncbi:MAG: calcium-binding protein [Cloacibacillus sp.]